MLATVLLVVQAAIPADWGEIRLRDMRQVTFGGQNAEAVERP